MPAKSGQAAPAGCLADQVAELGRWVVRKPAYQEGMFLLADGVECL